MEKLGGRLFYALLNLGQGFRHFEIDGQLSKPMMMLLLLIREHSKKNQQGGEIVGVTASDLSRNLEISKPAVTKAVNCLEERGMVLRTNGQQDRRHVYIRLTPEGERILEKAYQATMQNMDRLVQRLGEADVQTFIQFSGRIARECQNMRPNE